VLGFARSGKIAAHFGLDREFTDEALLDFEANGWVTHSAFAGNAGWSITDRGRGENERRLALELPHGMDPVPRGPARHPRDPPRRRRLTTPGMFSEDHP
jgi:hypothetical protein